MVYCPKKLKTLLQMEREMYYKMNMKRIYESLRVEPLRVDVEKSFMVGSVTAYAIKPNNVVVEDFHQGFSGSAFNGNDFKELSFD